MRTVQFLAHSAPFTWSDRDRRRRSTRSWDAGMTQRFAGGRQALLCGANSTWPREGRDRAAQAEFDLNGVEGPSRILGRRQAALHGGSTKLRSAEPMSTPFSFARGGSAAQCGPPLLDALALDICGRKSPVSTRANRKRDRNRRRVLQIARWPLPIGRDQSSIAKRRIDLRPGLRTAHRVDAMRASCGRERMFVKFAPISPKRFARHRGA